MTQPMGMGDLAKPEMVFVRQFRWTLKGKYLLEFFNKDVEIDYYNHYLHVSIYEVHEKSESGKPHAHVWADRLQSGEWGDEELIFTTFDGCGNELYAKRFSGLKVQGRSNKFDYSSSDVASHNIFLYFDSWEDVPTTETVHATTQKECQVDHLNAKMTIK